VKSAKETIIENCMNFGGLFIENEKPIIEVTVNMENEETYYTLTESGIFDDEGNSVIKDGRLVEILREGQRLLENNDLYGFSDYMDYYKVEKELNDDELSILIKTELAGPDGVVQDVLEWLLDVQIMRAP